MAKSPGPPAPVKATHTEHAEGPKHTGSGRDGGGEVHPVLGVARPVRRRREAVAAQPGDPPFERPPVGRGPCAGSAGCRRRPGAGAAHVGVVRHPAVSSPGRRSVARRSAARAGRRARRGEVDVEQRRGDRHRRPGAVDGERFVAGQRRRARCSSGVAGSRPSRPATSASTTSASATTSLRWTRHRASTSRNRLCRGRAAVRWGVRHAVVAAAAVEQAALARPAQRLPTLRLTSYSRRKVMLARELIGELALSPLVEVVDQLRHSGRAASRSRRSQRAPAAGSWRAT